jgi:DnaJ-domain-containing protein 1
MQPKRALNAGELSLQMWLRRRRATAVAQGIFSVVALLAAALAILAAIFFFTYAVVWFAYNYGISAVSELIFGRRQHISHNAILIICWCFLALLFIENARVSRDYSARYSTTPTAWSHLWLAGLLGSIVALLVNANDSARMTTDLLLTGPRLMGAFVRAFHRTLLLIRADLQTWSNALMILASRTSPVSAAELNAALRGHDSSRVLSQLAALGTVLFIRKEPPTVALDPDFREQLQRLLKGGSPPEFQENAEPPPATAPSADRALYELLGVAPSASLKEIRAAYRTKMKQWHPDVFTGRSENARQVAEEKTKAIIAAYEALLAQY